MERVNQFPCASTILLQLLRHNDTSNNEHALLAESLAYSTLQASSEFKQWLAARPVNQIAPPSIESAPLTLTRDHNELHITLSRPQARNAYSTAMRDALYEALELLDADVTLTKCVITGAGACFCVGGDLTEFGLATDVASAHVIRSTRNVASLLMKNAARIECRVHRACIGSGIELPACAGKVVATEDTFFQLPELSMGLIPGAGGTVSILRRIGRHRLAWWVLSGKKIKAATALEWGLIDQIV
jgi:enoyl-CoA hydratase/carnithine racemase